MADEPAASLDLSVQAQLLDLLARRQRERGIRLVLITHNLTVLKLLADRVGVMYLGKFVEIGPTSQVFTRPAHPYTQALVGSLLSRRDAQAPSMAVTGEPPNPINPPAGCHYHPRCPVAEDICQQVPPPSKVGTGWSPVTWRTQSSSTSPPPAPEPPRALRWPIVL